VILTSRPRRTLFVVFAVMLSLSLGCKAVAGLVDGGNHDNNGTGDSKNWTMSAALTHTALTIAQAAADTETITVTRGGGYTGDVAFTAHAFATGGITITVDNVATANNITTARVIVAVGGSFPVTANGLPEGASVSVDPNGDVDAVLLNISITITAKNGIFVGNVGALSVGQGSVATLNINLTRTNFTDPVPMSLATTQAGLTATFSPNPVTGTATVMTIAADASVPLGTYSVGVRANAGDLVYQATAPLALTVTTPGSIVITTNLPTLIVPKGSSVPTGVNIARTNYAGPVTLAVTGLPAGVTAIWAINPVSTNAASVSFTATAGAVAGTYPVTITASGVGITNVSVPLNLQISP
jgi:hypothetical protein